MTPTLLHAVARRAGAGAPDADLLARFARDRDDAAFEELVRRHGPLVWAVCRHTLPDHADAEDAFQAVFLALVRSAPAIRDGRSLPAWLHGVALRVASRAKRAFARRARERHAARPEAGRPVADGAWEALLAAVHEEVQKLPAAERIAFVLCDLEGVSQPDAAARLGWPLGTVSGRLCKARQRLIERLTARGLAPAAVGIGATVAGTLPANLLEVVKSFPASPATASTAAAVLARGLTEGFAMKVKLLTAALVVAAGFGATGGAVWLSKADAQPGGLPPTPGEYTPFRFEPSGPVRPPTPTAAPAPMLGAPAGAAVWEYKFVDANSDRKEFEKVIKQHGNEGWEFAGADLFNDGNKAEFVLVFKKRKGDVLIGEPRVWAVPPGGGAPAIDLLPFALPESGLAPAPGGGTRGGGRSTGGAPAPSGGRGAATQGIVALQRVNAVAAAAALNKLFPTGLTVTAEADSNALVLSGDPTTVKLAVGVVELLEVKAAKPAPGTAANALTVVPLKHMASEEVVGLLEELFPYIELKPEPRTNAIIVRADAKTVDELKALLDKIDVEVPKGK